MSRSRVTVGLPVVPAEPEVPLYEGNIEADIRRMNCRTAEEYGGRFSHPSKMDVPAYGIPATRCRIGSVLAQQAGTTCSGCYALKGFFRMPAIQNILEENYQKLFHPLNVPALAAQLRWMGEERVRWFLSGDLQGVNHLLNIIQIANAVRDTVIWMPSREIGTVTEAKRRLVRECLEWPKNLIDRMSGTLVDGRPPKGFAYTSTVVTVATAVTCPASVQGGNCGDHGCTRCWTQEGDVPYLRH